MRKDNRRRRATAGLTLVELLVVTVVVCLFALILVPAVANAFSGANMTALGTRGKDIYVAVIGATAEREPLGLPTAWPSDAPGSDTSFDNSTDYFRYLLDEERLGTPAWEPVVAGLDYSRLAGAGVPMCSNNRLTAACNAWTVAKNVGPDMDESMPVIITRNVDASSLASLTTITNSKWTLRHDAAYEMPYGSHALILIRKSGAVWKTREPFGDEGANRLTYQIVYGKPAPREDAEDFTRTRPLQYLTPLATVKPGEAAYQTGLADKGWSHKVFILRMKREFAGIAKVILPTSFFWCVVYLAGAVATVVARKAKGKPVAVSAYHLFLLCVHFVTVVLYSVFSIELLSLAAHRVFPVFAFALAIVAHSAAMLAVAMARRGDHAARLREMKWMLPAPLFVGGAWLALAVVSIMMASLFG